MHLLLQAGNAINSRRTSHKANAFKLSSLNKFVDMRTPDKAWSLLDFVVEALELDLPRHCDEIMGMESSLSCASQVDLRQLCNEVSELERAMAKVQCFLSGQQGGSWSSTHGEWVRQLLEVQEEVNAAVQEVRDAALWHGEQIPPGGDFNHSKEFFDVLNKCAPSGDCSVQ